MCIYIYIYIYIYTYIYLYIYIYIYICICISPWPLLVTRKQFGSRLIDFQAVGHNIARISTKLHTTQRLAFFCY